MQNSGLKDTTAKSFGSVLYFLATLRLPSLSNRRKGNINKNVGSTFIGTNYTVRLSSAVPRHSFPKTVT